jgi:hypothetical protein
MPSDILGVIINSAKTKRPQGMRELCNTIIKRNDVIIEDIERDKEAEKL